MRTDKTACLSSMIKKGGRHDMENDQSQLTGAQQKLIESAAREIINSHGSSDVIEEEAIKVASLAGRLLGNAREAAIEQLMVACTRVNKPQKPMKALITESMEIGDSLIKPVD